MELTCRNNWIRLKPNLRAKTSIYPLDINELIHHSLIINHTKCLYVKMQVILYILLTQRLKELHFIITSHNVYMTLF